VGIEAVLPEDLSDVPAEVFDDISAVEDKPENIVSLIDTAAVLIPLSVSDVDAVLDDAAVVQLPPNVQIHLKSFVTPCFLRNFQSASKVDTVFDVYSYYSLKASTRES